MSKKISIIIPIYNEEATIYAVLAQVNGVALLNNLEKEVVLINDGSNDDTEQIILQYQKLNPSLNTKYLKHSKNRGKGASIHTGIKEATGDIIVIQDADLEYNPSELNKLLQPILEEMADVTYGSRFKTGKPNGCLFFAHYAGNRFLTLLSNMLTNLNLTDMETCYKMFRAEVIKSFYLQEQRFGFEPEITAKVSRYKNIKISEVSISYKGRSYKDGKKIKWIDGFYAVWCIMKYNIWSR